MTASGLIMILAATLGVINDAEGRFDYDYYAQYSYDALGRQIGVARYEDYNLGDIDLSRQYVVDTSGRILAEYTDSGILVKRFVWSPVGGSLVLRDYNADASVDNSAEQRLYALHDTQGNVTSIADVSTGSGVVLERYLYTPHGDLMPATKGFRTLAVLDANWNARPSNDPANLGDYDWTVLYGHGRYDFTLDAFHQLGGGSGGAYDLTAGLGLRQDPALAAFARHIDGQDAFDPGLWSRAVSAIYENPGLALREAGHFVLDLAGMIPIIGIPFDLANGVWYSLEGRTLEAGLSFGAAVPGLGYAANAARYGNKATKLYRASYAYDITYNLGTSAYFGYEGYQSGNRLQMTVAAFGFGVNVRPAAHGINAFVTTHPRFDLRNYEVTAAMGANGANTRIRYRVPDRGQWSPEQIEVWKQGLPIRHARTTNPSGEFQVRHAGPIEYLIQGGGERFWADGLSVPGILEAKYVYRPSISPFIPASRIDGRIRDIILEQVDNEFRRMAAIIGDPNNPLRTVRVIVNDHRAVPTFQGMLQNHGLDGIVEIGS